MANVQRLLNSGSPAEAAAQALSLANEADQGGHPRQAANLRALAARAPWPAGQGRLATAGDETSAVEQAQAALDAFEQLGMSGRASAFEADTARYLRSLGMDDAARRLEGRGVAGPLEVSSAPARRGRLPGKCQGCGAPVRPNEVEWLDDSSAKCAYCGSVLQTAP
jgi:hypothetical protein